MKFWIDCLCVYYGRSKRWLLYLVHQIIVIAVGTWLPSWKLMIARATHSFRYTFLISFSLIHSTTHARDVHAIHFFTMVLERSFASGHEACGGLSYIRRRSFKSWVWYLKEACLVAEGVEYNFVAWIMIWPKSKPLLMPFCYWRDRYLSQFLMIQEITPFEAGFISLSFIFPVAKSLKMEMYVFDAVWASTKEGRAWCNSENTRLLPMMHLPLRPG